MVHFISQTQDDNVPSTSSLHEETPKISKFCFLELMEHSDLCAIDPGKNAFRNNNFDTHANQDTAKIVKHMLDSSQHINKLRIHVSKHGCLSRAHAEEIIRDIVIRCIHSVSESIEDQTKHTPHRNWAIGVLLYLLMCGPPPNNHPKAFIDFYNQIGLGVVVVHSKWFGSTGKRKKWTQLDFDSKVFILKLIHTGSKVHADAFPEDLQWSESLLQKDRSSNTSLFEAPCPVTTTKCPVTTTKCRPSNLNGSLMGKKKRRQQRRPNHGCGFFQRDFDSSAA